MGAPHKHRYRSTLAVALGAGLIAAPFAALPASAADEDVTQLNFININDFHGRIDENTVKFAGTVEQLRAQHPDSTAFISAGDNIGASLFASSVQNDEPTLDVLNALKLEASATGNHEYDKGVDDLTGRVAGSAEFPYLAANVTKDGELVHKSYKQFTVDGVEVAVVAGLTQETPTLVSPGGIEGLKFGDPVDAVNQVVKDLKDGDESNGEADVIVAEYHEGASAGTPDGSDLATELAHGGAFAKIVNETSPDVDVIFTGHTHKEYAWEAAVPGADGKTRPVVQTGSYGENLGHVVLDYDAETKEATASTVENVKRIPTPEKDNGDVDEEASKAIDNELVAKYPRVEAVKPIVDDALKVAEEKGSVKVGEATADITTAFADGNRDDRANESTLGNLVADSLLSTLSSDERGGADIGVVNPGGLRADLSKGDITYAKANAVLPFVNNLWTTTLTGAQFKEALEQQWQLDEDGKVPSRPYLQLGLSKNVSYTYDADAKQGEHITSVRVNGAPLDLEKDYTIGSFSFLLQGGDNFRAFADGKNTKDTGLIDRDAWIDYLKANSPVSPDFARHAVGLKDLPTKAVKAGSTVKLQLSKLDLTSTGSPANAAVTATLEEPESLTRAAGDEIGSAEVQDGAADLTLSIPEDAEGDYEVKIVADPSGTTTVIPLSVTAAATTAPTEEPPEDPTESAEPTTEAPVTEEPTTEAPTSPAAGEATPSGTDSGELADTGADVTGWVLGGVIAVMLGAGLTALGKRRSRRH
ncbi:5'-nucleotidase C-terminal domain-containing protein [Galactobacter sp.]|uniref:5'-nucleotidase C-terminal domain-containing protein n=1 Tax=Galactobacter sp. TaxID=2676125 RepID=UPI0025B95398|nr:5'-nucleotidase C-terminal domain-containing protein [Galactobacter sp.]